MGIRILKGGMLTTVQDLGRTGYQSQGFGVSGVMDVRSFRIANLLLDNPENEAVLEFTLIGPTLEFTATSIIAITGGDFQPTINDEPAPMYTAIYMKKGDILKFGSARTGTRGSVAFSGYLGIPVVMGSRCTNLKSHIGGFKGRKLEAGDYINFRIKRPYLPFFLSRTILLRASAIIPKTTAPTITVPIIFSRSVHFVFASFSPASVRKPSFLPDLKSRYANPIIIRKAAIVHAPKAPSPTSIPI